MARETLEIYAPIAGRLGISKMKAELEDLAFKTLNASAYDDIETKLRDSRAGQQTQLDTIRHRLQVELQKAAVQIDEKSITGRQKHVYGIHRKMQKRKQDNSVGLSNQYVTGGSRGTLAIPVYRSR